MKCLLALKDGKNFKKGDIIRVSDAEADLRTAHDYWKFIPKKDWKGHRPVETPKVEEVGKVFSEKADKTITVRREETVAEKQLKRKKQK